MASRSPNAEPRVQRESRRRQRENLAPHKLMLLFTVVDRRKTEFYIDLLQSFEVNMQLSLAAQGTAKTEMLELIGLAKKVEEATKNIDKNITVAVMGCVVNGIGEAGEADIGIAGGDGCAVIFKNGNKICKVSEEEALPALLKEIELL